uniref:Mitogen-activated protein kinase kinase kinase kinase n=1 Tax=Mesocestoides corti TaxID=53468 RepID=A0A5K3FCV8_MESCO
MHHPELAYLRQIVKQSDPKAEYRILANIGSGTYGDVYKAQRRDDRRLVAIKIMKIDPKDDIRAICQEIHTLMECSHPNIVQYYGSYLRLNKLWICMEFCGGQSMQDIYLYTRIPLEEDCIAFVTRETLKGLWHMHARNRIHRDIKGANILLTDNGDVKIADFGVAAKLSTSAIKRSTVIGTPYWMAPEVASVEHRGTGYDGKCDIWAVGITAIEYAELQPPLFDLDPLMALQCLGARNYKPPNLKDRSKWSPRFRTFIKLCLTKNERNRPDAPTLLTHDFVANPNLSINSTRDLLYLKRTMEAREKAALAASPSSAANFLKAAVKPEQPLAAPPIPQKSSNLAAEQPIRPVSVNRERPRSLRLGHGHDKNGASGGTPDIVDQFMRAPGMAGNNLYQADSCETPPPQPPKPTKSHAPPPQTGNGEGEVESGPRLRISSLRRPIEATGAASSSSASQNQPITAAGWPPGDHRPLPEHCLDESNEDLVAEVLDEYEKRQSKLFSPYDGLVDPDVETVEIPGRLSFYESEAFDDSDDFGGPKGLLGSPRGGDALRMRSKRQAPAPPPPLPPKGEGLKSATRQSSATAPGPISALDPQSLQPDVVAAAAAGNDRHSSDSEYRKTTAVPPPRPPPPRLDSEGVLRHAELQHQMERGLGLPPTPKVLMGACFTLIFEGCPLKVNATATWVNPITKAQMIIFGTNDGIYYLNLQELADATLELMIPRRCIWLTVFRDTMMSLSGNTPHLYGHNLVNIMKAKTSQDPATGNLTGRLSTRLLPKRFQPTVKIPNTRGCYMASVVRNPSNGNKYLCAVIDKSILVMEWFNPRSTFVEVKRVEVPSMPSPVYNFDLVCSRDQSLPTVCLGVYKTSDPNRFRLHMVDLNNDDFTIPPFPLHPEDYLPIVKVAHVDYSVLMICFQDHAKFVDFRGHVCNNRQRVSQISFDTNVASVVCLRDGILAFHPFGLRGFGFDGQLTQDINDPQHIYQLLGSDRNIVVESRPIDDPMSKSNLYLLFGHENSY